MKEKIMKLCLYALEIQREVLFAYKNHKSEINKSLKSKKEVRVLSSLYNNLLLMYSYAQIVFRNTVSEERYDNNKDQVKDAVKSIDTLWDELKEFDKDPVMTSAMVRCRKERVKKILKECDLAYKSLHQIGDFMDARMDSFREKDFAKMNKLVRLYTYRARALGALTYSMLIMFRYKER